jgi:hypothetical protein
VGSKYHSSTLNTNISGAAKMSGHFEAQADKKKVAKSFEAQADKKKVTKSTQMQRRPGLRAAVRKKINARQLSGRANL